jgi:hypothetical protein
MVNEKLGVSLIPNLKLSFSLNNYNRYEPGTVLRTVPVQHVSICLYFSEKNSPGQTIMFVATPLNLESGNASIEASTNVFI